MEQQLKQRLIGAIVLVSLAVIFIPFILEGPDEEWMPRSHEIPVPPQIDYRAGMEMPEPVTPSVTKSTPLTEPGTEVELEVPPVVTPDPAAAAPRAMSEPEPPPAPVVDKPAEPAPVPAAAPVVSAPASSKQPPPGWYAQVGSFSQQQNAEIVRAGIVKAGYPALLQEVDTGKGSSYRVVVGPKQDRPQAEQLLQKLGKDLKHSGIVIEIAAP